MNVSLRSSRYEQYLFWLVVLILLLIMEILVRARVLSPASYAAPSEIILAFPYLFGKMGFFKDLGITTWRTMLSLALGSPLGFLVAIGIFSLGKAQSSAELLLDFVRSIPITTAVPLFIAIFGVGDKNKIAIGSFSAFLITAITVWTGMREERSKFETLLYLYRPNYYKKMFLIVLPYIMPTIIAALKLAVSTALILVVVAEMFVGTNMGVGKVINDMTYSDQRAAQYAAIVSTGALGYGLNILLERLRRYIIMRGM